MRVERVANLAANLVEMPIFSLQHIQTAANGHQANF